MSNSYVIKPVSTILFDVGHTLLFLDNHFFFSLAQNFTTLTFTEFVLLGARTKEHAYRTEPDDPYKTWFANWMTGAGVPESELDSIFTAIIAQHEKEHLWCIPEPSLPDVLIQLRERGLQLGVISNSDGTVNGLLERFGFDAYFKCIVDSAEVGVEKPDARIFHYALKQMDVAADEALYVGDLEYKDVQGAESAGLQGILIDPYNMVQDPKCLRIGQLSELLELVERRD